MPLSAEQGAQVLEAHGILSCLAWGAIIPLGAVLIRVIPSKKSWIIHGAIMLLGLSMVTASFGMGLQRLWAYHHDIGKFAHTIIGTLLFAMAWVQPILGTTHHFLYQVSGQRSLISAIHVFFGRLFILIGMVNGGVGLLLRGNATRAENIAYGTVVGGIWVVYILLSLGWEIKRETRSAEEGKGRSESESSDVSSSRNMASAMAMKA
ncbi:integral membrane [Lecanosticta acicola]|uniref:Integral membrane n=1 Tax=Lecanosticta acicola TaxID=111012 RepID=A0AAI8Z8Y5_9PEZI|nr:integral membrane [Lecanosticta acicola]